MSDWSTEAHGYLLGLSQAECWQLLSAGSVGRIAWVRADRPFVIPVNYAVVGAEIHIRSAAYSTLVREIDGSEVAFQVDDIDTAARCGSTVTAQGRAEIRFAGTRTPIEPTVEVWPSGAKAATIAVDVAEISGRRLTRP
jgi:hypothetical protein